MKRAIFHLCIVMISLSLLPVNSLAELAGNETFPFIGDPSAKKGGTLRYAITSYPATFRLHGPNSNTVFISLMSDLVYQTLIDVHPNTLEFIPDLADAWEVQEDNKTFLFRLNPRARWEDGRPVTPEDVVFSFELVVDPGTKDPYSADLFGRLFEKPEIIDEHTVKFTAKTLHWRNFIFCGANLPILPAHTFKGKNYVEDFNWEIPNGSGPYKLEKFKKGSTIIFTRRDDFWAADERRFTGLYNFDRIKFSVVRDRNLMFEKFKKGEYDYYRVNVARRWVEGMNFDKIQQGWIQKRKVFTFQPNGVYGLALNMRQAPLDDVRVRKALGYLSNRPLFMDKLFFNEYVNTYSYFPGSIYENPENERIDYNPDTAQALLEEAGWNARNSQGILEKDGAPFIVTVLYGDKASERHLTIYQEDLKKAGIELKLKLVDYSTMYKLIDERNFHMANMAWNALLFPNPESSYHSKYADIEQTNNITGIKHPEIDAILDAYPEMFDVEQRTEALRALDGLVYREHPYVLNWYGPFTRILYWNRFGMPASYFSKFADSDDILSMWWYDEDKDRQLQDVMKKKTPLQIGVTDVHYWDEQE